MTILKTNPRLTTDEGLDASFVTNLCAESDRKPIAVLVFLVHDPSDPGRTRIHRYEYRGTLLGLVLLGDGALLVPYNGEPVNNGDPINKGEPMKRGDPAVIGEPLKLGDALTAISYK